MLNGNPPTHTPFGALCAGLWALRAEKDQCAVRSAQAECRVPAKRVPKQLRKEGGASCRNGQTAGRSGGQFSGAQDPEDPPPCVCAWGMRFT